MKSIAPPDFFVLRSPLLPFDEFVKFGNETQAPQHDPDADSFREAAQADVALLRARLENLLRRPEIAEAVCIASHDLDEALQRSSGAISSKLELPLLRYFSKMTGSTIPFGVSVGITVGHVGDSTQMELENLSCNRKHCRLDGAVVSKAVERAVTDRQFRRSLRYFSNSSLYRIADKWRYAEGRQVDGERQHYLVEVDHSPYLARLIEEARFGAEFNPLVAVLTAEGIDRHEAEVFLHELVDSQILLPDICPAATGDGQVEHLLTSLHSHPDYELSWRLTKAHELLKQAESGCIEEDTGCFREVNKLLHPIMTGKERCYFQVDMEKRSHRMCLGHDVLRSVERAVWALRRLFPHNNDGLQHFVDTFLLRYGDREVPLTEVLDGDFGIALQEQSLPNGQSSLLLNGIEFRPDYRKAEVQWSKKDYLILQKLLECEREGKHELVFEEKDLMTLEESQLPLPDAFAVTGMLGARSRTPGTEVEYVILLRSMVGPSGARMLGRLCHLNPSLEQHVREHLRREEALQPGRIFAEIVHLPTERTTNIVGRPVLRPYEIPYLSRSGTAEGYQIPITDLGVKVVGRRIVLRSLRLNQEVVPRLCSAHAYRVPRQLELYRFLCLTQDSQVQGALEWDWGVFSECGHLPRVRLGNIVFQRERWCLTKEEVQALCCDGYAAQFSAMTKLRAKLALPRFVLWKEDDGEIPVDLDNVLSVAAVLPMMKTRGKAELVELFPAPEDSCVIGENGKYLGEFVIPFTKENTMAFDQMPLTAPRPAARLEGVFLPGSEWLYFAVYLGRRGAESVLERILREIGQKYPTASAAVKEWFFTRYVDPHFHIRLRFHGAPQALVHDVLPAMRVICDSLLREQRIWKIKVDTYDQEVDRYGGARGILLAEKLFCADSSAFMEILPLLRGDENDELRAMLALKNVDLLLEDVGMNLITKHEFMEIMTSNFRREFDYDSSLGRQLGKKFRQLRNKAVMVLERQDFDVAVSRGVDILQRRSQANQNVLLAFRSDGAEAVISCPWFDFLASVVHMNMNRMFPTFPRANEMVLYDILFKSYESMLKRKPLAFDSSCGQTVDK
jgi:thiopeptide-type bacteriocin biosynthesis protein